MRVNNPARLYESAEHRARVATSISGDLERIDAELITAERRSQHRDPYIARHFLMRLIELRSQRRIAQRVLDSAKIEKR